MISPSFFHEALQQLGVDYFAGVPDSLLKAFCAYVSDNVSPERHTIAANEGSAVGLAVGYHLATNNVPLVYMQNSGLGNTVNPLLSLADSEVYSIPMLLLIGWRGEPGVKDEPQHVKQGRVTLTMLEAMEIPHRVIDGSEENIKAILAEAVNTAADQSAAYALVIKKGTFESYQPKQSTDKCRPEATFDCRREEAIQKIVDELSDNDIVVATTGMASRELFEYRAARNQGHHRDFLTVGGMGHASQIALGIAAQQPGRRVICIDGDGAALMHLGAMSTIGTSHLSNYKHFVINNGAHDSVGGQATVGLAVDIPKIAKACGYNVSARCSAETELTAAIANTLTSTGPSLLEIRVNKGSRSDLGRPTTTTLQNKRDFMQFNLG